MVAKALIGGVVRRLGALALVGLVGAGCTAIQSGDLFDPGFWAGSPLKQNDEAELGIAELYKGNFVTAEGHFNRALRANPQDIEALLGAGVLYQNTGQLTKAREMFEAVLALRPDESRQFVVLNNLQTQPASRIASVNLSLIDSGGVLGRAQAASGQPDGLPQPLIDVPRRVTAVPQTTPFLGRTQAVVPTQPGSVLPSLQGGQGQTDVQPLSGAPVNLTQGSLSRFSPGERNKISRFSTIRALRDQGLVTEQEFLVRRTANIGALLPLTSPQPAAGLDRPVPSTEQISNRLRAIGRALQQRSISVSQHAAERNLILTALLPEAPVRLAPPVAPPRGLIAAADSVAKLEQLRDGGFISSDEYTRERLAVERALQPEEPVAASVTKPKEPKEPKELKKAAAKSGPEPGVHLASYRSVKQADAGWKTIQRRHQSLLKGLKHEVRKVNLGKKGTFYRLIAGPVKSKSAQRKLCADLKRRRQFCEPSMVGG